MSEHDIDPEGEEPWRRRRLGWVVGALLLSAVLLAVGARSLRGGAREVERIRARTALMRFEANPVDSELARAAIAECEAAGQRSDAERVRQRHKAALAGSDKELELQLRARLEADPRDDAALGQLVGIYLKRKDPTGAKRTYLELLARSDSAKRRANFGAWLYRQSDFAEGAQQLSLAIRAGGDDPYTKGYLGLCYYELGRRKEAQKLIDKALEDGADMDALRVHQAMLDQELGAQKPSASRRRR